MVEVVGKTGVGTEKIVTEDRWRHWRNLYQKHLDAETLDELEELLITADMGVKRPRKWSKVLPKFVRIRKFPIRRSEKPCSRITEILQLCEQNLELDRGKSRL